MRFLAIICLLFTYVESAYAKDAMTKFRKDGSCIYDPATVNEKKDPLRDIKELLRVEDLKKNRGNIKSWPGM